MSDAKNILLKNIWYHALPAHQLKPGKMLAKTLAGEPVLLGRTRQGQVFAMRDICPHRGIPLSYGRFDGREVECPYHGWRFDAKGHCTRIPSLLAEQSVDLNRFDVAGYRVKESQGHIWIYIPDPNPSEALPPRFDIPVVPGFPDQAPNLVEVVRFPCFVDHAVLGLMDPAHSPYVHRAWWWRSATLHEEVKTFDPYPYGFQIRRHTPDNMGRLYWLIGGLPEIEITFCLPGFRVEEIRTTKHRVCNLTTVTPLNDHETEVTFSFYWSPAWGVLLKPVIQILTRAFLNQDKDVVVKQQDGLKYEPVIRFIMDSDAQARWYHQLKSEYVRATAEQREFVNPVKTQTLRWQA